MPVRIIPYRPPFATMADESGLHPSHNTSNKKRKRPSADRNLDDSASKRQSLGQSNGVQVNGNSQAFTSDDFAAQLRDATENMGNPMNTAAVALGAHSLGHDTSALSFATNGNGDSAQQLSSFDLGDPSSQTTQQSPYLSPAFKTIPAQVANRHGSSDGTPSKPQVGTDEWHKLRRDNHKEGQQFFRHMKVSYCVLMSSVVERRRREAINEGINALAAVVPGCEKNKGAILQRSVVYINELKSQVTENNQKKIMEKAVLEQALQEFQELNTSMSSQLKSALQENDLLKRRLKDAGVDGESDG